MKRIRLQIVILPWTDDASESIAALADNPIRPWTQPEDPRIPLHQLVEHIEQRYHRIYIGRGALRIKELQDHWGNILDLIDSVGDVFDDRKGGESIDTTICRVVPYPPDSSAASHSAPVRAGSLAPESSARPRKRCRDARKLAPCPKQRSSQASIHPVIAGKFGNDPVVSSIETVEESSPIYKGDTVRTKRQRTSEPPVFNTSKAKLVTAKTEFGPGPGHHDLAALETDTHAKGSTGKDSDRNLPRITLAQHASPRSTRRPQASISSNTHSPPNSYPRAHNSRERQTGSKAASPDLGSLGQGEERVDAATTDLVGTPNSSGKKQGPVRSDCGSNSWTESSGGHVSRPGQQAGVEAKAPATNLDTSDKSQVQSTLDHGLVHPSRSSHLHEAQHQINDIQPEDTLDLHYDQAGPIDFETNAVEDDPFLNHATQEHHESAVDDSQPKLAADSFSYEISRGTPAATNASGTLQRKDERVTHQASVQSNDNDNDNHPQSREARTIASSHRSQQDASPVSTGMQQVGTESKSAGVPMDKNRQQGHPRQTLLTMTKISSTIPAEQTDDHQDQSHVIDLPATLQHEVEERRTRHDRSTPSRPLHSSKGPSATKELPTTHSSGNRSTKIVYARRTPDQNGKSPFRFGSERQRSASSARTNGQAEIDALLESCEKSRQHVLNLEREADGVITASEGAARLAIEKAKLATPKDVKLQRQAKEREAAAKRFRDGYSFSSQLPRIYPASTPWERTGQLDGKISSLVRAPQNDSITPQSGPVPERRSGLTPAEPENFSSRYSRSDSVRYSSPASRRSSYSRGAPLRSAMKQPSSVTVRRSNSQVSFSQPQSSKTPSSSSREKTIDTSFAQIVNNPSNQSYDVSELPPTGSKFKGKETPCARKPGTKIQSKLKVTRDRKLKGREYEPLILEPVNSNADARTNSDEAIVGPGSLERVGAASKREQSFFDRKEDGKSQHRVDSPSLPNDPITISPCPDNSTRPRATFPMIKPGKIDSAPDIRFPGYASSRLAIDPSLHGSTRSSVSISKRDTPTSTRTPGTTATTPQSISSDSDESEDGAIRDWEPNTSLKVKSHTLPMANNEKQILNKSMPQVNPRLQNLVSQIDRNDAQLLTKCDIDRESLSDTDQSSSLDSDSDSEDDSIILREPLFRPKDNSNASPAIGLTQRNKESAPQHPKLLSFSQIKSKSAIEANRESSKGVTESYSQGLPIAARPQNRGGIVRATGSLRRSHSIRSMSSVSSTSSSDISSMSDASTESDRIDQKERSHVTPRNRPSGLQSLMNSISTAFGSQQT